MVSFILTLHLLIIFFFIIGFPVGLVINNRHFRYFHSVGLALVTLLMILGIPCPLTVLEEGLHNGSYEGSFIATWLNRIIYMEWFDPRTVLIMDVFFAALVFSSFYWYPVKKAGKKK